MSEKLFALLVHRPHEPSRAPFEALNSALKELSVETHSVDTCQKAKEVLRQGGVQVIFTGEALPDGPWTNLLAMSRAADQHPGVILVAAQPDTRFYLSVMEQGAFDFVAPPFERKALQFVLRSAALSAQKRPKGPPLSQQSAGQG